VQHDKIPGNGILAIVARAAAITPHVLEAYRLVWATDVGLNRFVSG
jgi:hypothetical protein